MSNSLNKTNYTKKRASRFKQQPHKPQLKQLLARLSESYQASHSQLVSQILENRSKQISQIRKKRPKYIWQNPMMPTNSIQQFSHDKPISSGEKFLIQKIRTNLLTPQRAFNPQPNIKAGSVDVTKIVNFRSEDNQKVISKKFEQFVRIVQEQSGASKRKRMSDVTNETSLPAIKSPYKVTMKKTYFKKFSSDQYNFYKPAIKDITRQQKIFQLTTQRQSTERSRSGQFDNSRQASPRQYRTLEIGLSRESSQKNLSEGVAKVLDSYKSERKM